MTALDRLIAAINEDGPEPREAQLALVDDLLNRRYRAPAGRPTPIPAGAARAAAPPVEQICPVCLHPIDEDGFCSTCGRQKRTTP